MKKIGFVFLFSFVFFNCSENNPVSPLTSTISPGKITLSFAKSSVPANVASVVATLSRLGYEPLQKAMNILSDTSASTQFDKVAVGTWKLDVKAYDSVNVLKYQGTTDVIVLDGQTTIANLTMVPVTTGVGNVQVEVTWGSTGVWIDNTTNPLLSRQNTLYDGRGVGYPKIFKDGAVYKMYYTNTGSVEDSLGRLCSIGLATSTDGNIWKHYSKTPIFLPTPNAWDGYTVGAISILKEDNIYKMFYTGSRKGVHTRYAIGLATSSDGIHWTRREQPVFEGTSDWENNNAGTVCVLKIKNEYWMYYNGYPITHIALATSSDGIVWTRKGIVMSPTQAWENTGVGYATVLYENGTFKMVYMNDENYPKFGYAISADGKNWAKSDTNPIFTHSSIKNNWAPYSVAYPSLNKIGNEYRIYYSGGVSPAFEWAIGYAALR